MNIPITQSKSWQKLQNDLGEKSFFYKEDSYQYLAILKTTPLGDYLYCPYGPVTTDEKSFKKALESLLSLAKKKSATFIRIEPEDPLMAKYMPKNAKKSKDLNPKDTWRLDLTADKAEIITNFSQGTRTRYNTYAKKGLIVESTKNLDSIKHLVNLQNKLFKEKNLNTFSSKYLKTELEQPFSTLYLVKYSKKDDETRKDDKKYPDDGQVLAASLFFDYSGVRYYMQSASDIEFRSLPSTVALLTQAIFDAKEKGIKTFDFWGIAPDGADKSHPWYGFTEFKKSFGGYPLHYAGTYDIVLKPAKYKLYQTTRKINLIMRKKK